MKTIPALLCALLVTTLAIVSPASDVTRYSSPRPDGPAAGGAQIRVFVTARVLETALTDFSSYKKKFKRFDKVSVLQRSGEATLVRLSVPTKVSFPFVPREFWADVRFTIKRQGEKTFITGRFADGNLHDLEIRYVLTAVSEAETLLNVEILMIPKFPCPSSYLTKEFTDAAVKAAKSFKRAAESENRTAAK